MFLGRRQDNCSSILWPPVNPSTMKRTSHLAFFIPLLLLLCGFFWRDPSWEQINATIEHNYPSVKNIDIESLKASLDQGHFKILIDVRKEDEFASSRQHPKGYGCQSPQRHAYRRLLFSWGTLGRFCQKA
jgi:hypothetical protein